MLLIVYFIKLFCHLYLLQYCVFIMYNNSVFVYALACSPYFRH